VVSQKSLDKHQMTGSRRHCRTKHCRGFLFPFVSYTELRQRIETQSSRTEKHAIQTQKEKKKKKERLGVVIVLLSIPHSGGSPTMNEWYRYDAAKNVAAQSILLKRPMPSYTPTCPLLHCTCTWENLIICSHKATNR
jgi:hypothetical protein